MESRTEAVRAAHPARALCGGGFSGAGALAMAATASALWPAAIDGHGQAGLIAWVLVAAATTGAALCLYLAVIWSLAGLVLMIGPASRTGTALLGALRILAPQLARRILVGTVLATTATGLALVPASASTTGPSAGSGRSVDAVAISSELTPALPVGSDPDPEASAPTVSPDDAEAPRPGLGWGESAAGVPEPEEQPLAADLADDPTEGTGTPGAAPLEQEASAEQQGPLHEADAPSSPGTVVVHAGDTLWSITDDLLGPAPEDPSEIAAAWPLLHEANRDVIGHNPDHLEPGQELTVPAPLTSQESS
ncbi:LysM peptidoglycan-binding domain-containing protein [Brachybacterium alimentarium]|uniref:LysM peptidoglycan-binding domain-containing protein n=2 Tax=Brachybacterium alimentarium TaxID=47845 RepID=UPI0011432BD4|nr:LysM peptidoglycan-binding domain-containing protein [Brachybacterium alimentarium]